MKNRMLISLLLFSSHLIAASGNPIGTVLFTVDKVIVEQNHAQRTVTRGASLYSGDTIITDASGQAKIKYNNGSLVTVQPNSNYVTSPASGQNNGELNATLNKGTINYSSTGKKKQGVLHTPIVSLAILGTAFVASYSPSTKDTTVSVSSGKVSMGGVTITPGQTGTTSANGSVTTSTTSSSSSSSSSSDSSGSSGGGSTSAVASSTTAQTTSVSTATTSGVEAGSTAAATATISIGCGP